MKKFCLILCALVLLCTLSAQAAEYPSAQGAATDLAEALSPSTITDFTALSERYESATGGKLYAVTRHFLGGADVKSYAKELFSAWALGENDALLLMVIGEETYALQLGEKAAETLPAESKSVLLGSYFREKYLARDYDGAVGELSLRLAAQLARGKGETLSEAGLFGAADATQAQPTAQSTPGADDFWGSLFSYGYNKIDEIANDDDDADRFSREDESTGFSFKRLMIFAIIIYFLFFRKKRRRRFGRR